ncbi:PadR family transcriptional regulator [Nocardioides mesophilus]|uniref:PadR family transcriptional regulator n=2 Tax=Nocardioides mesophilus TaxID=433659 RepID=A0A7G9RGQ8_9ACTN|nr:PadR family transcriptional regulator [Nocardioides mesophilus]
MGSGSWDMPWDDPRAGEKGSGPRGGRGSYGRGSTPWGSGPWGSGPPPWLHGLLGLAQSGMSATKAPRARRGDVRAAILDVLAVEPMNGYQVIQQIAERSGGAWKPSPGSVYPTVQQLEDEGLVVGVEQEGRRLLTLTDAGHAYVEEHPEELAATWRAFDEPSAPDASESHDLKPVIGQVMSAVWQVVVSGTRQQQAEAAEILGDTRRRLYHLLADGDPR